MKNKKIFSGGLYLEGIRRLRLIGIIFLVIFTVSAVLIPVGEAISQRNMYVNSSSTIQVAESVSGYQMNGMLILLFFIAAPLISYVMFGFINHRNSSDFHHALPHTRVCIFLSFFAAVLTWLAVSAVISTAASFLTVSLLHKYLTMNIMSSVMYALGCFTSAMYVSAAAAFAMTITGTVFSNVVITGIVMFFPRIAIAVTTGILESLLPMTVEGHLVPALAGFHNVPVELIMSVFTQGVGSSVICRTSSVLYMLALGIIFTVAALLLFCRRRSESAERSAPNRTLQAVYRITLAMAICIVTTAGLFAEIMEGETPELFPFVTAYVFALIVYFAYELITTKKWKNLVTALPGVGIIIALNLAIFGGMYGIYNTELNYSPSADDITSISLSNETDNNAYMSRFELEDYIGMTKSSVKITDKGVIKLISDALAENIRVYRESSDDYMNKYRLETNYVYDKYTDGISSTHAIKSDEYTAVAFRINTASGSRYRTVYLSEEENDLLIAELEKNESYRKLWQTLPEPVAGTLMLYDQNEWSAEEAAELYDCMKKEVAEGDFAQWYKAMSGPNTMNEVLTVSFSVNIEMQSTELSIPLYADVLPETAAKYYAMVYEKQKMTPDMLLNAINSVEKAEICFDFYVPDGDTMSCCSFYGEAGSEDITAVTRFIRKYAVDEPVSVGEAYVIVRIDTLKYSDTGDYFTASDSSITTVSLKGVGADDLPECVTKK